MEILRTMIVVEHLTSVRKQRLDVFPYPGLHIGVVNAPLCYYWLRGVESGNRTLRVSAQGFKPASEVIRVGKPGSEQSVDFPLARLKDGS